MRAQVVRRLSRILPATNVPRGTFSDPVLFARAFAAERFFRVNFTAAAFTAPIPVGHILHGPVAPDAVTAVPVMARANLLAGARIEPEARVASLFYVRRHTRASRRPRGPFSLVS